MRIRATTILLGLAFLAASATHGDFLVTLEGRLIETDGPWSVEGGKVVYTDLEGEPGEIALDSVDLEASEETTALRAGKPYVPSAGADNSDRDSGRPEAILYVGWRCRPCEEAGRLLDRLGVAYVEKYDEERSTRNELRKKVGRRYILPVVDLEGKLVIGHRPDEIRRIVRQLEDGQEESEEPTGEEAGGEGSPI